MRFLTLFGAAGSMMILAFAATSQAADPSSPAAAPRGGAQIPANGGRITLEVNKGTLVRLSGPAATVFVANPEIADVQVKSPTLVYITAKSPGETVMLPSASAVLFDCALTWKLDWKVASTRLYDTCQCSGPCLPPKARSMPWRRRMSRAQMYTMIASTYIAPMKTSDDLLLTKYRLLENHSYKSNPSSAMVTQPASGTS